MADAVLKSLIEEQISVNDVTEWLSSDVSSAYDSGNLKLTQSLVIIFVYLLFQADELKVANENNVVCSKGDFVLHILNLLRQSFLR